MHSSSLIQKAQKIKKIAFELGFDNCGIAEAMPLDEDAKRLEKWLHAGFHGEMKYMENHFDLKTDPTKLVPGAKSVITLTYNYFPEVQQKEDQPKVAKYAYGKDYHLVIREKLHAFMYQIQEEIGHVEGRGFVDSAPVLERTWANKSGLGWIGKNGNLINKHQGSFFFLAVLITDLELAADNPVLKDYCGTCTKCIDACPTEAILPNKVLDARKCISYLTIELKSNEFPASWNKESSNWVFGCDICQDVCPWNRFSKPHTHEDLQAKNEILEFSIQDWIRLDLKSFKDIFKDSAISRTKWDGLQRNLKLYKCKTVQN